MPISRARAVPLGGDTISMVIQKPSCLMHVTHSAMQSQKAISAHFTSEQKPPFGFARQYRGVSFPIDPR